MKFVAWLNLNFRNATRSNLLGMGGGKWYVPEERFGEFVSAFCKARKRWTKESRDCSFVFCVPKVDSLPIYVDLDLRYTGKREQPIAKMVEFGKRTGFGDFYLVCKPETYEKKAGVWAGGCHLLHENRHARGVTGAVERVVAPRGHF